MPDVFASSTAILTSNLASLTTNYLIVISTIIGVSFGFFFLWKIVSKGRRSVH